jgi:hypothetical protein
MYLNATMIHELRMVILHASKLLRRSGGLKSMAPMGGTALKCVHCLYENPKKANDAVTVARGNSVCMQHLI